MKSINITLVFILLLNLCCAQDKGSAFKSRIKKDINMNYLLQDPPEVEKGQSYPLIVFLHGAGERGEDLKMVNIHGPVKYTKAGGQINAFILTPQCPKDMYWDTEAVYRLILDILEKNPIDESQIYLTGLSMGGWGTWKLAMEHPELFAAIAPICGPVDQSFKSTAFRLKDKPIWIFHGALDRIVPIDDSRKMIEYLKPHGIEPQFTVYPKGYHDSWTETYNNPEFYDWLFSN